MTRNKHHKTMPEEPAPQPVVPQPGPQPVVPQPEPEQDSRDAELADLKGKLLRLHADFENHRKRLLRERQDMAQQALSDLMLELLPVLDNLDRGREVAAQHQADQTIRDGFELIINQLCAALARFGLAQIEDSTGKPFDPNTAEAISYPPSPTLPEGTVMAETRRGYRLHGRLLRAAQVVVSSGPGQGRTDQGTPETGAEE